MAPGGRNKVSKKEQKAEKEEKEKETIGKDVEETREPETKTDPEKIKDKKLEETELQGRTPVKERVRNLNKKTQASPGKFPLMKQQMMEIYFKKKSPKASKARERREQEPEEEYKEQKSMGTSNSPFLGVSGKLGPKTSPSKSPSPESEECGRIWGTAVKKKALKALVSWPFGPRTQPWEPQERKTAEKTPEESSRQGRKRRTKIGRQQCSPEMAPERKGGLRAPKTCLGPKKAKEPDK